MGEVFRVNISCFTMAEYIDELLHGLAVGTIIFKLIPLFAGMYFSPKSDTTLVLSDHRYNRLCEADNYHCNKSS